MISSRKVTKKFGARTQVAALCYRQGDRNGIEILLITSRSARRWIVPKGWPIDGLLPHNAAAQEAFEEAGVKGQVYDMALGRYRFCTNRTEGKHLPDEAYIFPLEVSKMAKDFKEKGQRKIRWFSPKKAALRVREPKLKRILREFDPKLLTAV